MNAGPVLLLAETDETVKTPILKFLLQKGGLVLSASTGEEALQKFRDVSFHAVILSDMLLDPGGCAVCREMKKKRPVPVIMLTRTSEDAEQFACYQSGADVCLPKPVSLELLSVRLGALLKRSGFSAPEKIVLGGISIAPQRHELFINGRRVLLTPREFSLLYFLCQNRNIVLTREQLLEAVWENYAGSARTVDTHIKCLRKKIAPYSEHLVTLRKVGYKFEWRSGRI